MMPVLQVDDHEGLSCFVTPPPRRTQQLIVIRKAARRAQLGQKHHFVRLGLGKLPYIKLSYIKLPYI